MSDTIAAVSTGNGVSAIGIVRLSGDRAIEIVSSLFKPNSGKSMAQAEDRKLIFGTLCDISGTAIDICLCTVSHAPNSYTGEDTAELQCHGSPTVLRAALDALFSLGARQAQAGEFTKRAFLNGRMDLVSAEAVADIIDAETIDAAKNAVGQLGGAVSRRIEELYGMLTDISSHYHAVLDYPDEDIEDFMLSHYESELSYAVTVLERLSESYNSGKLLQSGIPAAIIGCPNAGKSSLLNALLGYDRAIVTDIPGTTRDTIEEKLLVGKVLLRLTDTAGIRDTEDVIEKMGVERSRRALKSAELVLAVIDGSRALTEEDTAIIRAAETAPHAIVLMSKSDLTDKIALPETKLPILRISSLTGEGLDGLSAKIAEEFPMPDVTSGEILTNARQADAVRRALLYMRSARKAMTAGCTPDIVLTEAEGAMTALGELTGRTVREDVTNRIFQRFCVGK